jgi:flagellar basal-body rod protein FlgG
MLKGLFDAAAGMKTRLTAQDIIANNLANAGTAGFQREIARIESRPMPVSPESARAALTMGVPGGAFYEFIETGAATDTRPGALHATGAGTDVALDGEGYLTLRSSAGIRLTRGGPLRINSHGELATPAGDPLLDTDGAPIVVGDKPWQIGPDGTVTVDGKASGRLRVVLPEGALRREGATLFAAAQVKDAPPASVRVLQGFLEHSNVESVREMVDMIAGVRAYESAQRAVQTQDHTLQSLLEILQRP